MPSFHFFLSLSFGHFIRNPPVRMTVCNNHFINITQIYPWLGLHQYVLDKGSCTSLENNEIIIAKPYSIFNQTWYQATIGEGNSCNSGSLV